VFRDKVRLQTGQQFRLEFITALTNSTVFVPVFSSAALDRMLKHNPAIVDNVLIEWLCAVVHYKMKRLKAAVPVMFGRSNCENGKLISTGNIFTEGILDSLPEVVPTATVEATKQFFQENGLPFLPAAESWTVKKIVEEIKGFLGISAWELGKKSVRGLVKACASKVLNEVNNLAPTTAAAAANSEKGIDGHQISTRSSGKADTITVGESYRSDIDYDAGNSSKKSAVSVSVPDETVKDWNDAFEVLLEEKMNNPKLAESMEEFGLTTAKGMEYLETEELSQLSELLKSKRVPYRRFLKATGLSSTTTG
jgi:hypothetical protein